MKPKVVIIGAGPAGLTAGYLLSKNDVDVLVLEADPVYVGGISRTTTYKGFHFDIGGPPLFFQFKNDCTLWLASFAQRKQNTLLDTSHRQISLFVFFFLRKTKIL